MTFHLFIFENTCSYMYKSKDRDIHAEHSLFQGEEIEQGHEEVDKREIISFLLMYFCII